MLWDDDARSMRNLWQSSLRTIGEKLHIFQPPANSNV